MLANLEMRNALRDMQFLSLPIHRSRKVSAGDVPSLREAEARVSSISRSDGIAPESSFHSEGRMHAGNLNLGFVQNGHSGQHE